MIKFTFFIFIVSFFIGPRLFSGVRFDDFLLLFYFVLLILYLPKLRFFKIYTPLGSYLIFLLVSFLFYLYGLSEGVGFDTATILYAKYFTYFLGGVLSYHYATMYGFKDGEVNYLLIALIGLNTIWVLYQMLSGQFITLWGVDEANSYGIKLIGEAAALQVGMLLTYFGIYLLLYSKNLLGFNKFIFLGWYLLIVIFTYFSQSRISLFGLLFTSLIIISYNYKSYFKFNCLLLFMTLLASLVYLDEILALVNLSSRFSFDGIQSGLAVRADYIWGSVLSSINNNLYFGMGIGSLTLVEPEMVEVHNYYLKILLEGGILYFFVFFLFLISCIYFILASNKGFIEPRLKWGVSAMLITIMFASVVQDAFASTKVVMPLLCIIGYLMGSINYIKEKK